MADPMERLNNELLEAGHRSMLSRIESSRVITTTLKLHQHESLGALLQEPNMILADETGLGKTLMVIAAINHICRSWHSMARHSMPRPRFLLVPPANLIFN
jgi:SNF2 family DNA or RNA helicase